MTNSDYLPEVRRQYEAFPFPPRDPEEESQRLVAGVIDHIALINHYCFRGKQSFEGRRVLVAGGGTGDSTIFWAEQLREKSGEVVHIDISKASLEIAKQRAAKRKLDNIVWVEQSLLQLPTLDVGTFDYINCYGVLHHLEDPPAGLQALASVLNDGGAIGLLLYGTYGRLALYQIQQLAKRFRIHSLPIEQRVARLRALMESLPPSNWYKLGPNRENHTKFEDEVFFDSYLHSQDRSYTVPELYEFVESGGFHFVEFCHASQRIMYRPETFIRDRSLLELLPSEPRERQAAAELIGGQIGRHEFYISTRSDTAAVLDDMDNVPFFFPSTPSNLIDHLKGAGDQNATVTLNRVSGIQVRFKLRRHTSQILQLIDGKMSLGEIFERIRRDETDLSIENFLRDFRPTYEVFNQLDMMLLRDESIPPIPRARELQAQTFG